MIPKRKASVNAAFVCCARALPGLDFARPLESIFGNHHGDHLVDDRRRHDRALHDGGETGINAAERRRRDAREHQGHARMRQQREAECFPVINRGWMWYSGLNLVQWLELKKWYLAWLNVTETLRIPERPTWLDTMNTSAIPDRPIWL